MRLRPAALDRPRDAVTHPGAAGSAPGCSAVERVGDPADTLTEIVVAERKAQPRVARRAERLARHDRDLRLFEQHLAQLEGGLRATTRDLTTEHAFERREAIERALRLEALDARDA